MTMDATPNMIPLVDGCFIAGRGYQELRDLLLRGKVRGERRERGKLFVSREDCEALRDSGRVRVPEPLADAVSA